jgi:hypothetical protein
MDRTETQRVEEKDRPRAHGKNVANDSAYSCCSALERFNCAGVVVALHLKGNSPTVANVDYAGVLLSGFHEHFRTRRRKLLKLKPRILVGAMFAPHDRKHPKLGKIRVPA